MICQKNPLLKNIPYWVTREDYEKAKPAPDGYLEALALYGKTSDQTHNQKSHLKNELQNTSVKNKLQANKAFLRNQEKVIGFEDTLRGLKALQKANPIVPVLICSEKHPQMKNIDKSVLHFESFLKINSAPLLKKDL